MKGKIFSNQIGTSLIEIMFAISIFSVLMTISLGILKRTIDSQRSAIAAQNTQESMRYLFEMMSKEIRSAKIMNTDCNGSSDREVYYASGASGNMGLWLKNKDNECVNYYIGTAPFAGRLMVNRVGTILPVTPNDITVTKMDFLVADNTSFTLPANKVQPRVTVKIEAESITASAHKNHTIMQTTISSRNY